VLPITKENEIVLIKQFRIPLWDWQIETPAGLMDKSWEDAESSARRELLEETGYEAWELEFVYRAATSAGLTNELIDCFVAHDCILSKKKWELDAIEQIETLKIPLEKVYGFLAEQAKKWILIESKVYGLLGLYLNKLKNN
jgi:ADP-ribose pyrophosphatase